MMKKMYKLFFVRLFVLLFSIQQIVAQEDSIAKKSQFSSDFSIELNSSYFWRSAYLDPKPNIQPLFTLNYCQWSAEFFGSSNFDNSYREFDYALMYHWKGFTIQLSDYLSDFSSSFSDYTIDSPHLVDAILKFQTGEKYVLSALVSCMVWGNDKYQLYNYMPSKRQNYSTYIQTSYAINNNDDSYTFILGATTHKGMYANNLNVVNIGFEYQKLVQLFPKYAFSPKFGIWYNPASSNLYFNCGIAF